MSWSRTHPPIKRCHMLTNRLSKRRADHGQSSLEAGSHWLYSSILDWRMQTRRKKCEKCSILEWFNLSVKASPFLPSYFPCLTPPSFHRAFPATLPPPASIIYLPESNIASSLLCTFPLFLLPYNILILRASVSPPILALFHHSLSPPYLSLPLPAAPHPAIVVSVTHILPICHFSSFKWKHSSLHLSPFTSRSPCLFTHPFLFPGKLSSCYGR